MLLEIIEGKNKRFWGFLIFIKDEPEVVLASTSAVKDDEPNQNFIGEEYGMLRDYDEDDGDEGPESTDGEGQLIYKGLFGVFLQFFQKTNEKKMA